MPANVLLLRPQVDKLTKFSKPMESLALGYIASSLRAHGHGATLVDAQLRNLDDESTALSALDAKPDAICITSVLNYFDERTANVVRLIRGGGFGGPIILGGHAVSFFPERILASLPELDAVNVGEGELNMVEVARALSDKRDWRSSPGLCVRDGAGGYSKRPPLSVDDLDDLPPPARDLTKEVVAHNGIVTMLTSRGCYARCTFCSIPRFYGLSSGKKGKPGGWRCRRPERVVDEIATLHRDHGVIETVFVDDEFFGASSIKEQAAEGKERAVTIAKGIEGLRIPFNFLLSCRAENVDEAVLSALQRAGLTSIFIGLEAGNPSDLRIYGKAQPLEENLRAVEIVKRLGLRFQAGMMLFNFRSTLRELKANVRFLQQIDELKPMAVNSAMDPHFGAPIADLMEREGVLIDEGLRMRGGFLDDRVRIAKRIAEVCAGAFEPFMSMLSVLQSVITWEWRRRVPVRKAEDQRKLDALEREMNQAFSGLFVDALETLDRSKSASEDDVVAQTLTATKGLEAHFKRKLRSLVVELDRAEGPLKYWTQEEVRDFRHAAV